MDMIEMISSMVIVFGVATLVADYDGVGGIFTKLRELKLPRLFEGVFDCSVCLMPYLSVITTIAFGGDLIFYFASLSGAILMERITAK